MLRQPSLWRIPLRTLGLGVFGLFGLFGFHFLLCMALRGAPPVEANLVNYLWPLLIMASALVWASYSLLCQRVPPFPTAAIGLFALVSGLLSLVCHLALEPAASLTGPDWGLLAMMGIGPLGAAFYLWDMALKTGDVRRIGILSYITPLASTALLILVSGRAFTWNIAVAAVLILAAAFLGSLKQKQALAQAKPA